MSLRHVSRHAKQESKQWIGSGWRHLKDALLRILDREREMLRLRVSNGMMSEARQSDAVEYDELLKHARELSEKVRQLEVERDAWRAAAPKES